MEGLTAYQTNRMLIDFVLFLILIPSLYYDLWKNIIPNFITFSGIIFGLIMIFILGDSTQIQGHLFGLVLGFGFFYIFYLFGWVGGGDVKLMGVIGLLKGVVFLVQAMIWTAIFGGLIGIIVLAYALLSGKSIKTMRVPYGTAICLGAFTVLAMQYGIINSSI